MEADPIEDLISSYTFGAIGHWQDRVAIGSPIILNPDGAAVSDVANPFFGDEEFYADAWVAYDRKLTDKIDWKIQFNVRNLIGGDADNFIPIRINPLGDVQNVRLGPERQYVLTNTVSF